MKGGKEEGKSTVPLFPRLHVNDREKGGPRAPPRNKMALYEQFSTPSRRLNSSAASPVPITSPQASTLVASGSSNQGYRQETSVFAPSDVPAKPSIHLDKAVHSQALDCMRFNSTRMEIVRSSKQQADNCISSANRSAGDSLHLSDSSNVKKSRPNNFDDEDDFMVPSVVQSRTASFSKKNLSVLEPERLTTFCARNCQKSSSRSCPNASDKPLKGIYANNARLNDIEQKHIEERYTTASLNRVSNRIPDSGRRFGKPQNFVKTSSDQEETGTMAVATASGYNNANVHPEYCSNGAVDGARCLIGVNVVNKGEISRVRKESCPEASLNSQIAPIQADICNQESEVKATGSPEIGDVGRNEVSEASLPDSVSGIEIGPDDVVGVIGPKHFWKARRAIVNQQRIFAIQVFELHRLIKVQKLLAATPDVLKVDLYLSESLPRVPVNVMPPENIEKSHGPSTECPEAKRIHDSPVSQIPRSEPSHVPLAPDERANPWCFHPPQNQLLVPVMSPSEGLIYKPYIRPCLPTAGFMAPFYGSYVPLSFPSVSVDSMNLMSGVLPYHQQPPIYFPSPCGLPITNPIISSSGIKQVSPYAGSQPIACNLQQSQSSCKVLSSRSEVISGHYQRSQASKGTEVQGSKLTIPCENVIGGEKDALPLFHVSQDSNGTKWSSWPADEDNQNRVIRVVPHNARLATESAARIFRSIQDERKQ